MARRPQPMATFQGCNGFVLIKGGNNNAEVDTNKHQGVVSCADIVILAAQDAVAFTGRLSFDVPTNHRDGKVSNLRDADSLPDVKDGIDALRSKFAANGLSSKNLVLLSAAHTVGTTTWFFFQDRLYNFPIPNGNRGADPSISPGSGPAARRANSGEPGGEQESAAAGVGLTDDGGQARPGRRRQQPCGSVWGRRPVSLCLGKEKGQRGFVLQK